MTLPSIQPLNSAPLWVLTVHFKELLKRTRHVDYAQGEAAARRLAQKLRRLYTPQELAEMAFLPIPRGGFFVLGWLAYQLALRPEQLTPPFLPDRRLCIVDDAAFSGRRFREVVQRQPQQQICLALLYASQPLQATIEAREERVEAVVCAYELQLEETQAEGTAVDPGRYRHDSGEIVTFAWSETDKAVFNPFTQTEEYDWRLISPHRCLKNRLELGQQLPVKADPDLIVPNEVVYALREDTVWLLQTETEEAFQLQGGAARLWRALAGSGNIKATFSQLDLSEDELKQLLDRLVELQLLTSW